MGTARADCVDQTGESKLAEAIPVTNRKEAITFYKTLCIDPKVDFSSFPIKLDGLDACLVNNFLNNILKRYSFFINSNELCVKHEKPNGSNQLYKCHVYLAGFENNPLGSGYSSKNETRAYYCAYLSLLTNIRESVKFLTDEDQNDIRNHMAHIALTNLSKLEQEVKHFTETSYHSRDLKQYIDMRDKLNDISRIVSGSGQATQDELCQIKKLQQAVTRLLIPARLRKQLRERDEAWALNAINFAKNWGHLSLQIAYCVSSLLVIPAVWRKGIDAGSRSHFSADDWELANEMRKVGALPEESEREESILQAKFAVTLSSFSIFASQKISSGEKFYNDSKKTVERCFKKKRV